MNSPPFLPSKHKDQTGRVVPDRICLLVLGMHRSGTSAVTRVLSIAGAKLPISLMGPGRGNEVGHWESDAIATYNDELLSQLGSRWGDWRSLEFARLPLQRRRDIQAEIADLLAAEFGDAALFVVKDPRICRFAPLFMDALDGAGIEPRIVQMVRNPLEVVESLERRDNMSRADAALQWLRHVLDSEASTRTRSRVIVTYASLLKDWRNTLERVTETLRVAWPYAIDDVAGQVAQFLDRDRRHHEHSVEDVLLDPALRGWMGEAYSALLVLENNPDSKAAITALDAIRREFTHAGPVLHALLADAQSASERQRAAVIAEREQEASHLRGALEERDQRIAGLGAALEAKSAEAQGLAAAAAEREREMAELRAALGEARDSAAASAAERERTTAELRAALDAAETRARNTAASLAERERTTAELRSALDDAETRARDAAAALAERERTAAELRSSLDAAETRARDAAASLAEREREATELQSALRNAETGAREIAASVAEREQESTALKAALRMAETRALRLVAALEESGRRIGRLDETLKERKHEAEQLSARLAEREAEGENLRATLSAAKTALSASEKEVAEIQALAEKRVRRLEGEKQALLQHADLGYQKLIDHFRSSTSWKVTRPLRALKDWLPHASLRPGRPRPRLRKAKGRSGAAAIIDESGLFNEQYYLSFVRDETIGDPIGHYLQHGSNKGIDPNPLFDSDYYTTRYAAHLDEITNPFVHFIQSGARQGFDPSPLFQTAYYRRSNLDVQTSDINPLLHYLKFGRSEGRMPIDADAAGFNALALRMHRLDLASPDSDRFNADLYAALYPEIVAAIGGDEGALASHYETRGRAEGRIASLGGLVRAVNMPPEAVPINFDESEYFELNADLGSAFPHTFFHAIRHYLESGIRERRRYSYSQCYIDAPWQAAASIGAATAPPAASAAHKVACLLHVGRLELWPDLLLQTNALDGMARDVFVSVAEAVWSEALHAQIRSDIPGASIVVSESEAGDGGGYADSLAGVQLDDYAGFLLIPSAAAKGGRPNGRVPEAVPIAGRLARMAADPSIGIIGAGGGQEERGGPVLVSAKVLKRAIELVGRNGSEVQGGRSEAFGSQHLAEVCAAVGARAHWN